MDPSLLIAARKRRRAIGYLGFKNARFGRIDAHIATCAFSREILKKAVAIAESKGFRLIHGIVDSMWLEKPGATTEEYEMLCQEIQAQLDFPIGFEGIYKWIVFLNSHTNPRIPVLNRYYGVFRDGGLKLRGIELRKHDTPEILSRCQMDMLNLFKQAKNAEEFIARIPDVLAIAKSYITLIRNGAVPVKELTIEKRLSKNPDEYRNMVPQAVAAQHLNREGSEVHAGQALNYVVTYNKARIPQNRALPAELVAENYPVDSEWYSDLLLSSTANLLLPFGYTKQALKRVISEGDCNSTTTPMFDVIR
jgi:DNA polymerase-2